MQHDILRLEAEACYLLDQRALPCRVEEVAIYTAPEMRNAIADMVVRGAPAIGIAAAYGVVLSLRQAIKEALPQECVVSRVKREMQALRESRPTAVNLMWALDRMQALLIQHEATLQSNPQAVLEALETEAQKIHAEDVEANQRMGQHGAELFPKNARIQTHCNAGALATGGYGTALGVIREAYKQGKCSRVYADETRPRLQGGKLTTWELVQEGIPTTLVTDGMSGLMMRKGMVDAVIVGADRIAANGDVANKIGTYNLALAAQAHGVPFYVAAPVSTFDPSLATGDEIPIEERAPEEVTHVGETRIAPQGVEVFNPGFDITPAALVTAIITERGVFTAPYDFSGIHQTPGQADAVMA